MGAEERTLRAIEITRSTVERIFMNPDVLVSMAGLDVGPDDVEDVITEILEYLEKTAPEEDAAAEEENKSGSLQVS